MNKLTDNEIIKGLECCRDCKCKECPCYKNIKGEMRCTEIDEEEILDLINRQKAEIEKYQHIKTTINEFWNILLKLKLAKRKEVPTLEEFAEAIGEMEAEAIKEFAERLKENVDLCSKYLQEDFPEIVDNLVKEMVIQTTLTKIEHNSLCETETHKGGV